MQLNLERTKGSIPCSAFFDELAKIKETDISILYKDHMEIFVESSKTNHGAWVVIARSGSKLCPVAMLERYM